MADDRDRLALLLDARLSADARVIGLLILELGEGDHEISHDQFRMVLRNGPSDETIRRQLRSLESTGWIRTSPGGRGHANRYRPLAAHECGSNEAFRRALYASAESFTPTPGVGLNLDKPTPGVGLNGQRGGTIGGGEVGRENAGSTPPVAPPDRTVDSEAEALIDQHADVLTGCRGALRDYLASRVPAGASRQRGYVATLVTWIQGSTVDGMWRRTDGSKVKPPERAAVLARALNELLASEEGKRAHDVGDPRNLENKITGILRDEAKRASTAHGRGRAGPGKTSSKGADRTGIGANQGTFIIEGDEDAA